jgi:hypothetical protein
MVTYFVRPRALVTQSLSMSKTLVAMMGVSVTTSQPIVKGSPSLPGGASPPDNRSTDCTSICRSEPHRQFVQLRASAPLAPRPRTILFLGASWPTSTLYFFCDSSMRAQGVVTRQTARPHFAIATIYQHMEERCDAGHICGDVVARTRLLRREVLKSGPHRRRRLLVRRCSGQT